MFLVDLKDLVVLGSLLIIIYYVSGFKNKVSNLYKGVNYLNTVSKLKAIDLSPQAIITIEGEGRILSWNKGAADIFGYKEKEVLGEELIIIIPERYRASHLAGLQRLKDGGQSRTLGRSIELEGVTKAGIEFPIRITIWKWTEGSNVFYTGIIKDITQDKKKQLETKVLLDMYETAEELNKSGSWSWDVLNDVVVSSRGFREIFGIEAKEVDNVYLMKRIFYEDLKSVEDVIKRAFEEKKGYTIEYRIVNTNGTLTKVRVKAETFFNDRNELVNLTGIIQTI